MLKIVGFMTDKKIRIFLLLKFVISFMKQIYIYIYKYKKNNIKKLG